MKLSAMLILYELGKNTDRPTVTDTGMTKLQTPISGMRIYSSQMFSREPFRDDVLYIAHAASISDLDDILPSCLFVSGTYEDAHRNGVVYIDMPFVDLINFIGHTFYEYNKIEEELNAAVSRNESLRTVLSLCAKYFNNPITISDMRLRFVEMSDNVVREKMPSYFQFVLDTGYIDLRVISAMRTKGYDKIVNTCRETLLLELEEVPARYFSKNIYDGNQIKACIVIHEVFSPIDIAQSVIVDQIAQLIDNYTYKNTRGKQATLTKAEQCISDLISGSAFNEDFHAMHLKEIGWEPDDSYILLKVSPCPSNYTTASYTFAATHGFFPSSLIVERETYAVIVICLKLVPYDVRARLKELEKYLAVRQDKAAVSRRFSDIRRIAEHYQIVSATLEIGSSLQPEAYIYDFRDYVLPVMLKICGSYIDLRVFCTYEAILLQEHDIANDGDLFRSLYVYLKHNRSLAAAARELNIHRNTLLYRLGRISEITGLDHSADSIYLPMVLSYEILHYRLKLENVLGNMTLGEST